MKINDVLASLVKADNLGQVISINYDRWRGFTVHVEHACHLPLFVSGPFKRTAWDDTYERVTCTSEAGVEFFALTIKQSDSDVEIDK